MQEESFKAAEQQTQSPPDSKVHGANMGPTWVMSSPDGPHVGPMNLAIRGAPAKSFLTASWNCELFNLWS